MKRTFQEHLVRRTTDLSGTWRFCRDPDNIGIDAGWHRGLSKSEPVTVPSCWNNELGLLNYEGKAWYEKNFYFEGGTLRLSFGSVMTKADVWLDGEWLGEHYGAFTEFAFIVPNVTRGEHILSVRVDNTLDKDSFPQKNTDWFNYGGIAREVTLETLCGITALSNHVVYTLSPDLTSASLHSEVVLYNACDETLSSPLSIEVGEHFIFVGEVTLSARETLTLMTPDVVLENITLWSPENPHLYPVSVMTEADDLVDRVGFRLIEAKHGDILLNGKSIELLGVNRHEEHPDWGFAFPAKLMKRDLDLICDLGCNTVRGAHYPNSRIFMDMLDERGLLFWCEIPLWGVGFGEEALNNPTVIDRGLQMHREMTHCYYNHPSIIIWGMHNEINTKYPCTHEISRQYHSYLRTHGGNRLITHAAKLPFHDSSMEFDDIICMNLYYGWYGGTLADWDKLMVDFAMHRKANGWEDKPVVMSEFGCAALYGYHEHFDTVRWSEEYQSDLLAYCLELFHKTDYMRGTYIWQFTNIRTSPNMDINRARYFNNKGILDEHRNPKAAYFTVKSLYRRFAGEPVKKNT